MKLKNGQLTLRPATTPSSFENKIKLKKGQLTLVGPVLRGAFLHPHSSFLGPGELRMDFPKPPEYY
jgi:hypothetical protein